MGASLTVSEMEGRIRAAQGRKKAPHISHLAYGIAVAIGLQTGEDPVDVINRVLGAEDGHEMTEPVGTSEQMLLIKSIDQNASLSFSEYTGKWFVLSTLWIGDGTLLTGISEHGDTPERAVAAAFDRLTNIDLDEYIVSNHHGQRREWRWSGAAFAETWRSGKTVDQITDQKGATDA